MMPWRITTTACQRYAYAMRWRVPDDTRARDELSALITTAALRDTDPATELELWRCSKRLGRGLRCVVDPRTTPPTLVWVGHGVPPQSIWRPQ